MATNTDINNLRSSAQKAIRLTDLANPSPGSPHTARAPAVISSVSPNPVNVYTGAEGFYVDVPISAVSGGPDLYVYVMDTNGAVSKCKIATNATYTTDTTPPSIMDTTFNGNYICWMSETCTVTFQATDAGSGIDRYEIWMDADHLVTHIYPDPLVYPTDFAYEQVNFQLPSGTTGTHTVRVTVFDRAGNQADEFLAINIHSAKITWDLLTSARSTVCPFLAVCEWKATATGTKLCGFYATTDFNTKPSPHPKSDPHYPLTAGANPALMTTPFDLSIGEQTSSGQNYQCIVAETNCENVLVYLAATDNNCVVAKYSPIPAIDYTSLSLGPPNIDVFEEQYKRQYTRSRKNGWLINVYPGQAGPFTQGDLITGVAVTESATPPTGAPDYDPATGEFVATGSDWTAISEGTSYYSGVVEYDFLGSGPVFAGQLKTVYVHVSTFGYSQWFRNEYKGGSGVQTFKRSTQITWIDDREGPKLINLSILGEGCTGDSTNSNTAWSKPSDVTTASGITLQGTLKDDQTNIIRYIITNSQTPPPFVQYSTTSPYSLAWIQPTPRQKTVNFSTTVTAMPPNGYKQFFIHSVDSCFNTSTNMLMLKLDDPGFAITPVGTSAGTPFKFEGNSSEHAQRKSIASMFGDGVQHDGYISKRTPDVQANRVHKLSEYRGMRVATQDTRLYDNLPAPSNPLKFSDFLNNTPRFFNLRITPHVSTVTAWDAPTYEGDNRNLALTIDIDTGDHSTGYIPTVNQKVVEIEAKWFITHLNLPTGVLSPQVSGTIPSGGILNYTFSTEGVYYIVVYDSFGNSVQTTYRIYPTTAILPPLQPPLGPPSLSPLPIGYPAPISPPGPIPPDGPVIPQTGPISGGGTGARVFPRDPINVPPQSPHWPGLDPNTGSPTTGGSTDFYISFSINQICLAVDACLLIDRSGSYVSGFSNKVYDSLSQTLDNIAAFSEDSGGNVNARFGLGWYWNPGSGIEFTSPMPPITAAITGPSMTANRASIKTALEKYKDSASGGAEPKFEITSKVANGALGAWRPTALKMILLYSDEPDSPDQGGSSGAAYVQQPTNPNFYINQLIANEIALVLYDAGAGAASKNQVPSCMQQTKHLGSLVSTLGTGSDAAAIAAAVNDVFDTYKDQLTFNLEPDISSPSIFGSIEAHSGIHASSSVPIPYNDLYNGEWAVFKVTINHDQLYALGANYIDTMVTIKNSIGLPIARKQIQIQVF